MFLIFQFYALIKPDLFFHFRLKVQFQRVSKMKDIACNQLLVLPMLMDFYKKIARVQKVRPGTMWDDLLNRLIDVKSG